MTKEITKSGKYINSSSKDMTKKVKKNIFTSLVSLVIGSIIFVITNSMIIRNYNPSLHGAQIVLFVYAGIFMYALSVFLRQFGVLMYKPISYDSFDEEKSLKLMNAADRGVKTVGMWSILLMATLGPILLLMLSNDFSSPITTEGSYLWFIALWGFLILYQIPEVFLVRTTSRMLYSQSNDYVNEYISVLSKMINLFITMIVIVAKLPFMWIIIGVIFTQWIEGGVTLMVRKNKYVIPKLEKSEYEEEYKAIWSLAKPALFGFIIFMFSELMVTTTVVFLSSTQGSSIFGMYDNMSMMMFAIVGIIFFQLTPSLGSNIDDKNSIKKEVYDKYKYSNNTLAGILAGLTFLVMWILIPIFYGVTYYSPLYSFLSATLFFLYMKRMKYWMLMDLRRQKSYIAKANIISLTLISFGVSFLLIFLTAAKTGDVNHIMYNLNAIMIMQLSVGFVMHVLVQQYNKKHNIPFDTTREKLPTIISDIIVILVMVSVYLIGREFLIPGDVASSMAVFFTGVSVASIITLITYTLLHGNQSKDYFKEWKTNKKKA